MNSSGASRRKKMRRPGHDYSSGAYYVTVRSTGAEMLGICRDGRVDLNPLGRIVAETWMDIPKHYGDVKLDEFIVMPDHLHGVIILSPLGDENRTSLSNIIKAFKVISKKACREKRPLFALDWQRTFHDEIIENETALNEIRKYIRMNPRRWEEERRLRIGKKGDKGKP